MDHELGERLRDLPGPVLVTGHTGFKGTWLTLLLEKLNVPVVGLSLPPLPNSLFERANRQGAIRESFTDIRNFDSVLKFVESCRPSVVVHMAAQPLVLESYRSPRETFDVNVMGTANVLSASFEIDSVEAIGVITTDKVYRNDNSGHAFIETDALEGKDPYSASKVGAEAATAAWRQISKVSGGPKVISLRAGNVVGGGDWAENRLLPDLIRGYSNGFAISARNPQSTRPWQHVLDPLRGYILAVEALLSGHTIDALNFGPNSRSLTVKEVVELSEVAWPSKTLIKYDQISEINEAEAVELHLDSSAAKEFLQWQPNWSQEESVIATVKWWDNVLNKSFDPTDACQIDIGFMLQSKHGLGIS